MFHRIPFAALAAVVAVTVVCVNAQISDCVPDREYTVKLGDICDSIGKDQKVSTFQIEFVNGLADSDCRNLRSGQHLCLGRVGQDCREVRVVKTGDICFDIARDAGIPLSTLYHNNPNIHDSTTAHPCDNIYPDEVLCISSTLYDYHK